MEFFVCVQFAYYYRLGWVGQVISDDVISEHPMFPTPLGIAIHVCSQHVLNILLSRTLYIHEPLQIAWVYITASNFNW